MFNDLTFVIMYMWICGVFVGNIAQPCTGAHTDVLLVVEVMYEYKWFKFYYSVKIQTICFSFHMFPPDVSPPMFPPDVSTNALC